ncbi:MAG: response regulator transcription factor [Clostridia bacterium]|nr:response regulator transcription factor [Clostridia bacterium]
MKKTRLMLVDDHLIIRAGLKAFIEGQDDLEVIAEADTAKTAIEFYESSLPDVVLMDVQLPGDSGIDACREICRRHPEAKVIMLSCFTDDNLIVSSIMAGAKGYISKVIGSVELIKAIHTVNNGGSSLEPDVTIKVITQMRELNKYQEEEAILSFQEKQIITLIAEGKTNRQIASELCLSDKTVKNYVSSILSKLGLNNRAEAAAYAVRLNYIKNNFASELAN